MGVEIVKVPSDFSHPVDEAGDYLPGAHLESLYYLSEPDKNCFQIYENVTEGTPMSPVFSSEQEMESWLIDQGNTVESVKQLIEWGHYPSLVLKDDGSNDAVQMQQDEKDRKGSA